MLSWCLFGAVQANVSELFWSCLIALWVLPGCLCVLLSRWRSYCTRTVSVAVWDGWVFSWVCIRFYDGARLGVAWNGISVVYVCCLGTVSVFLGGNASGVSGHCLSALRPPSGRFLGDLWNGSCVMSVCWCTVSVLSGVMPRNCLGVHQAVPRPTGSVTVEMLSVDSLGFV